MKLVPDGQTLLGYICECMYVCMCVYNYPCSDNVGDNVAVCLW